MEFHGWGRYPRVTARLMEPQDSAALLALLEKERPPESMIARGCGRSYGDSALAPQLLGSRFLDSFIALDESGPTIACGAGVTLDALLRITVPRGLFPAVVPGTRFVSVGGAIAADIHGKNHHRHGSFCDHVEKLSLALASGEVLDCSRTDNAELFHATCGGMGLTGIILDAVLKLKKVPGHTINRRSLTANSLEQCLELIEEHDEATYSVAWIDCLARGRALGRSILHLGEHDTGGKARVRQGRRLSVPFSTPGFLLNRYSMSFFNSAYFRLKRGRDKAGSVNYDSYFFPLDNIGHWNRLYGSRGFLQYQFVLPPDSAATGLRQVLEKVSAAGKGSFLAVLKKMGPANANLLSFPMAGYTLTLDFKREPGLFPLLDELDRIVIGHGGRHYLAKDARMGEDVFRQGYPAWEAFAKIKQAVDPQGRFASLQSDRLGLTGRSSNA